jgi:UPF0271 protein
VRQWEVDINCDVGEGMGVEALLFPMISSCNLACGGHAGDEESMREVIALAIEHGVVVGAHPSYPDRENFGRKSLRMSAGALRDSIRMQIHTLENLLEENNRPMTHIKAHGALYNDLVKDRELALRYLEAVGEYRENTSLYVPWGSVIGREAEASGFRCTYEAFADRNYENDLSLVSRKSRHALITQPQEVLVHLLRMIKESSVKTIQGKLLPIKAQTYCIHGDTSNAFEILAYLSEEFPKHHIRLKK